MNLGPILGLVAAFGAGADPCAGRGTRLLVDTRAHRLMLCDAGVRQRWFHVALATAGVAALADGGGGPSGRTPLGTFRLLPPQPSFGYGLFIPFAVPGLVGLHGPDRAAQWLGELSAWVDWTGGSLALGFDRQVQAVAEWLTQRPATEITLE